MGYDVHRAIAVTGFTHHLEDAHAEACRIFGRPDEYGWGMDCLISPIIDGAANTWRTFFVAPDGGKSSGPASQVGDVRRAEFVAYLKGLEDEEGQSPLAWVEVQYGDDYGDTRIVNDSDATFRALDSAVD